MRPTAKAIADNLRTLGDPVIAEHSLRFFKTGKGEYGEGDAFLGIRVPVLRSHVKKYPNVPTKEVITLLKSPFHEERLLALLMLVKIFSTGTDAEKAVIYDLYLNHTQYINNWDLVDSSASQIVGAHLENKDKKPLFTLAKSTDLWERRIAIISTFHLIKINRFSEALKISEILKSDSEDLIHKAVGWMLREIGKRNLVEEERYLKRHYKEMPRTMLRYAIEKFPEENRQTYLKGTV